ncbi:MAG TPA: YCF48-related protein [Pyrinomonadaceae bacterium]|nr:YCF48-related protein [Pyrinomonadaceae bacterium]
MRPHFCASQFYATLVVVRLLARTFAPLLCLGLAIFAAPIGTAQSGWTAMRVTSSGRDLNTIYFVDSKRGWIGGDEGFLTHTEDGGASWIEQRIDAKRHAVNDVYFANKEVGFALAGDMIFRSGDGGHSWQESYRISQTAVSGATAELYSLRFNGKKKGWVVGSLARGDNVVGSVLAITRDSGTTWQMLEAGTRQELIHIDFIDDERGWIVGAGGAILHTEDAGETWTRQESGVTVTLYHVDFRNSKQGIAVGERGTILFTQDAGRTWSKVTSPARATLLSVQFASEDAAWIVGRSGVILRSGDGGRTWVEQENTPRQNLYALFMNKKDGWAVGSDGLLLRYAQ